MSSIFRFGGKSSDLLNVKTDSRGQIKFNKQKSVNAHTPSTSNPLSNIKFLFQTKKGVMYKLSSYNSVSEINVSEDSVKVGEEYRFFGYIYKDVLPIMYTQNLTCYFLGDGTECCIKQYYYGESQNITFKIEASVPDSMLADFGEIEEPRKISGEEYESWLAKRKQEYV